MKVALVTGGSKGIGREVTRLLLNEGIIVYILGRDEHALQRAKDQLGSANLFTIQGDVSDPAVGKRAIEEIIKTHARLDLLVNNAGMSMRGRVADTEPRVVETMININYLGSSYLTYWALPHLIDTKGSVIFTSSLVALHGIAKVASYAAAKGALSAYSESLRAEVSPLGVHVGIIYVGFTENDPNKVIYDSQGRLIPLVKRKNSHSQGDVAKKMLTMITKRKKRMVLTPLGKFSSILYRLLPNLSDWIITRFNPTDKQYGEVE